MMCVTELHDHRGSNNCTGIFRYHFILCVCVCVCVCMYVCKSALCVYVYARMYVSMRLCIMYVCKYVVCLSGICVYVCMHTYAFH